MNKTEWIVFCAAHRHYLVFVSAIGTTWTDDRAEAKRYGKRAAEEAARKATWRDHNPIAWPLAEEEVELHND